MVLDPTASPGSFKEPIRRPRWQTNNPLKSQVSFGYYITRGLQFLKYWALE